MNAVIEEAIAIHVDTEGMDDETYHSIEQAIRWALNRQKQLSRT